MFDCLDSIYDISLTEDDLTQSVVEYQEHSKVITSEYELDDFEKCLVWGAGLLAAAVDMFMVTDVRNLAKVEKSGDGIRFAKGSDVKNLRDSGAINKKINNCVSNFYSDSEISSLEALNKVPYDASSHIDVVGLGAKTHRFQSFGHDPILGFYYGVRDIMNGTLTAIDNSGSIVTVKCVEDQVKLWKAITTQFGHLKSDLCTPSGLPIPFMSQLMRLSNENRICGMSPQMFFKGMYAKGYNINHLMAMSAPAIIIELIIRTSFCCYQYYKGKRGKDIFPINKPKLDKMLFQSYLIATGCNGAKIAYTGGNVLAFNPTLWVMTLRYGISEFKHWYCDEKEKKRHQYVTDIYTANIELLDAEIEKELALYK